MREIAAFAILCLVALMLLTGPALPAPEDHPPYRHSYGVQTFKTLNRMAHTDKRASRRKIEEPSHSEFETTHSGLLAVARQYMGTNPTGWARLWCGNFLRLVLRQAGHGDYRSGNLARAWASFGRPAYGPQVGAIAVLTRGNRGGHVGIVSGLCPDGRIKLVSGNHNRRVGEGCYPRSRVIAFRST